LWFVRLLGNRIITKKPNPFSSYVDRKLHPVNARKGLSATLFTVGMLALALASGLGIMVLMDLVGV
jgi:hypothetical protein